MSSYTHENVPSDIASRFPALQGKQHLTRDQVPAHVLTKTETVVANKSPSDAPTQQPQQVQKPAIAQLKQSVPTIIVSPVKTSTFTNVNASALFQKGNSLSAPADDVQGGVNAHIPEVLTNPQQTTYTHENVPAEILDRFPHLKNVQTKAPSIITQQPPK